MLGGALGAQAGAYLATIMNQVNTFAWMESALALGGLGGIVLAIALISFNKANYRVTQPDNQYHRTSQESSITGV